MTYNKGVEESQIATAEEVQGQVPMSPEQHVEKSREQAIEDFKKVIATKPGRQQVRRFLNDKAMAYLRQTSLQTLTRKQRRQAAREVSNRIAVKALAGEDIFDAGVRL